MMADFLIYQQNKVQRSRNGAHVVVAGDVSECNLTRIAFAENEHRVSDILTSKSLRRQHEATR